GEGTSAGDVRPHGSLRGRHQGSEGRWEAMRALSSRPFCSCDSRRVNLGYLSAGRRYTTRSGDGTLLCPAQLPGAFDSVAANSLIGINSTVSRVGSTTATNGGDILRSIDWPSCVSGSGIESILDRWQRPRREPCSRQLGCLSGSRVWKRDTLK